MLEVFCEGFHRWRYIDFSRLDRNIKQVLKKTFIAKGIYMGRPNGPMNQYLANFVIDEQHPIWNKNDLFKYKTIYPMSKIWLFLEFQDSPIAQQLTFSVETKIHSTNDRRQQSFTPRLASIIPNPANAFGPTLLTKPSLAYIHPIQTPQAPIYQIEVLIAQVLQMQVSLAQVLSILAATMQATISILLVPLLSVEHGHG